ncbi:MAG: sulfite exporter TauE/SafE family protein, partial [Chloroflexota bacterium]
VNRYSRIELYANQVRVRYVLDMAEIPTFQELTQIDANHDGDVSAAESERYRLDRFESVRRSLLLEVNGKPVTLRAVSSELSFPIGQGNLKTMRLSGWLEAATNGQVGQNAQLHFRDDNFAERIGWKEIVARAGDGAQIAQSDVPSTDASDELRTYPDQMLSNPLDRREANVAFRVVAASGAPVSVRPASDGMPDATQTSVTRSSDPFAQLIGAQELSVEVVLFSLLAALVWGSLHAFSPGHGKSVVAAYLVGARGTARHAVYLGLTITVTHTIGVYALGLVTLLAAQYILPEKLYPILGVISGVIVVAIGAGMFVKRLRGVDAPHHHAHDHEHEHSDAHEHHNHHLPADDRPLSMRNLLALGISGGLIPCPSALVVMLAAIALHRVEFGLILIVAFSTGLAVVLTATGLLLVFAGRFFDRLSLDNRLVRLIPVGSALVMTVIGLVITAQAVMQIFA